MPSRIAALLLAVASVAAPTATPCAEAQAPARDARALVDAAVTAMGGADKLRAVRTVTARGYAQYAYQNGGGRISGDPHAPEKLIGANALTRVYDLEHDRYMASERRNNLFPFLLPGGHAFLLQEQHLDGDVVWNYGTSGFGPPGPPRATRQPALSDVDGVHVRRMWMHTNPAVLMRALLDPRTRKSAPRTVDGLPTVDVVLAEGDRLSVAFGRNRLPAWVEWAAPQTNLGEVRMKTWFSGWVVADGQGGILLPLGYDTRENWRDVAYLKLYVDAYEINGTIPDLAAPADIRAAAEPPSYPAPQYTAVPIGRGLWRISNGTQVIAFKDHLVIFELGVNVRGQAQAVLDLARSLAPGKPITHLITSHNHFDHTAGLREAVAQGITVIGRPDSLVQFREMAEHPATEFQDAQARAPKPFKSIALDEHLRLQDETQTLDVYWGRNNGHMADVVFAYAPADKLLMEGDMVSAAYEWQHWVDTLRDATTWYKLDVQQISPVHNLLPNRPGALTRAEVEEAVKGGVERARKHCADEEATGHFHPGCPIQSKYY